MSVFIVERDSQGLRVVLGREFADRNEAVGALTTALTSGEVAVTGEVFVVDLGAAVPLVVVAVPPADEAQDVPQARGEEESPLAAALKRAADSLEAEGIVAPDSVAAGPEGEPEGSAEPPGPTVPEPEAGAEPDAGSAVAAQAELEAEPIPAHDVEMPPWAITESADGEGPGESAQWPWAHVESYAEDESGASTEAGSTTDEALDDEAVSALIEALSGDPVSTVAEPASLAEAGSPAPEVVAPEASEAGTDPLDGLEEPAVAESPLIMPSAIDGEEAYLPRPVILGDYEETSVPGPSEEPVAAQDDEAAALEAGSAEPTAGEAPPPEPAYTPGTDLDLGEYTCEDCIYVNTCPKVGQSSPAECGSFQWKAQ